MKPINHMPNNPTLQGYSTVPATSDAKEYLRLLLKHKLGLVFMVLLGTLLATLYLISTTPVYQASSLLKVDDQMIGQETEVIDFNKPTVKEEANILKSRKVLTPVVELYNMRKEISANRMPVLGDITQRIPALGNWLSGFKFANSYAWGDEELEISKLEVPREWEDETMTVTSLGDSKYQLEMKDQLIIETAEAGESLIVELPPLAPMEIVVTKLVAASGVKFNVTKKSLQNSLRELQENLNTETSDAKSRMITVSLRGENPEETANILNEIAVKYRDIKLFSQSRKTQQELDFYEKQMPRLKQDLETAEAALARYQTRAGISDNDLELPALLRRLEKLEEDMTELQIEKDEIQKRYTPDHPDSKRLDKKINVLQPQINRLRGKTRQAPVTSRELNTLEENVAAARKVFTETNEKLQNVRLITNVQVSDVLIWDEALPPKKPVSPKKLLAMVAAVVATLFSYIVWLTLRSALSTVINDQESLERASGLPVFINIPRSNAQRKIANNAPLDPRRLLPGSSDADHDQGEPMANILAVQKPEDYSVENMRGLRLMLEDVMDGAPNNVLMICSPLPNMGKSFVSSNLAVLLAQSGKRVLLLDADYQRGQLHKSFGLSMGPGLPEVVAGKSELKESVKATSVPNLYCIPRGFMGAGIAREVPGNKEFGAFLQVVAPRFDMVIIDTPPILSVSTAATLGRHAGSSFMVVKEGEIKEPQITEALKRLSFSGVRVNGCLMNSSSQPTPNHYAYYREQLD